MAKWSEDSLEKRSGNTYGLKPAPGSSPKFCKGATQDKGCYAAGVLHLARPVQWPLIDLSLIATLWHRTHMQGYGRVIVARVRPVISVSSYAIVKITQTTAVA